jgi:NAD(P)-dependent dehydrogenase (short-subunit alcohol dehydrogenase family)
MQSENRVSSSANPPINESDWNACLSVLESLQEDTSFAPDRERIERLIACIYKRTRKRRRQRGEGPANFDQEQQRSTSGSKTAHQPVLTNGSRRHAVNGELAVAESTHLSATRSVACYVCRMRFVGRHFHYARLCPQCADFQFEKRHQRTDLSGRRALVTGGRIKIGFETALKLLRDGAEVLVTTRFACDAIRRFAAQKDFVDWSNRLRVFRLDFRDVRGVLAFTNHLRATLDSLDILVNNAAQTIQRPPQYCEALAAKEQAALEWLPKNLRPLLGNYTSEKFIAPLDSDIQPHTDLLAKESSLLATDLDEYGEPIDVRDRNSWVLRLHEVSPMELLEVLLINTTAPYLLTSELKPLFLRSPRSDRYIVNVVGLDGTFDAKSKLADHPHLNMSKAALNMMTRTAGADYASDGIFMNSVDTGWITHEAPYPKRVRMKALGIAPPLDVIDGAAKIYDPIVRGTKGERLFGMLFRNYQPASW